MELTNALPALLAFRSDQKADETTSKMTTRAGFAQARIAIIIGHMGGFHLSVLVLRTSNMEDRR